VGLGLEAAQENGVKVMTRVLDHGGIFNEDLKPGHVFSEGDHRCCRPNGWGERGCDFLEQICVMVFSASSKIACLKDRHIAFSD
jgi:hypothetical protein